ncbi:MAG: HTTM domain-containing protein [Kofleriaceae bacterium]
MSGVWVAWVAFWDRRESPTALALVRILVGVSVVGDLANTLARGLVTPLYSTAGYANAYGGWGRVLGDDPGPVLFAIVLGAAIAMTLGAATRVACIVFALAGAQLAYIAPDADRGIDMIVRIVALVLALSMSHARWSVDAFVMRRVGRPMPAEVPAWPRYLLMLQLVWIYFSGGLNKSGAEWGPLGGFRALENIVTDPNIARLPAGWIAPLTPLARVATAATMVFELGAPLYLIAYYFADTRARLAEQLARVGAGRVRRVFEVHVRRVFEVLRVRWVWIALGACFHVGIAITLRLGMFPYAMLALYPVLLRPEELAAIAARVRRE